METSPFYCFKLWCSISGLAYCQERISCPPVLEAGKRWRFELIQLTKIWKPSPPLFKVCLLLASDYAFHFWRNNASENALSMAYTMAYKKRLYFQPLVFYSKLVDTGIPEVASIFSLNHLSTILSQGCWMRALNGSWNDDGITNCLFQCNKCITAGKWGAGSLQMIAWCHASTNRLIRISGLACLFSWPPASSVLQSVSRS